jgi:hypothetical protein
MKYIYLLLLLSSPVYARGEYYLVNLEKMDFQYAHFKPETRDPYLPKYTHQWKEKTAVKFRMGLLGGRAYWDNNVHGETVDTGVFKSVGWQWELGIRITDQLSVFHEHHSRHVMEALPEKRFNAGSQFPVEDSFGIKLRLIKETTGRGIF